ncbi:Uncharacterised protein [[Clostridium] sordellii]|nr:hypothetical protein [Paeniclostridium sordellii]CEN31040.1 Uncharacterised protein [[Clostridium] sordellii] [Paeniclostridium sordellii]
MKIYMAYKDDTREFNGFYQGKDNNDIPKPNVCISKMVFTTNNTRF